MLESDSAALAVLFIGGTGTISASCVRLSVDTGMDVTVLNRGTNAKVRSLPDAVTVLKADVTSSEEVIAAIGARHFDAVVNFLSFDADDAARMVDLFTGRTKQYVHISSGSIYGKPVLQSPITESTPVHNRFLPYARAKIRAEQELWRAHADRGFPLTIVRPSHTYDDANPPLPGDWTVVDRIARGAEIPVHGDGTSLWTLTHAEDFAQGLVGLLGNPRTLGEAFNITASDVYTWDQIYTIVGEALGVEAKLVHIASEMFPVVAPDWFWSGEMTGDIGHSAVFDTTKIERFVPGYAPRLTFHRAIHRIIAWREAHPDLTAPDASTDEVLERLVGAYHQAAGVFASWAPGSGTGR